MKELGFVVTKEGRIINFGEYNCYAYRDRDNKKHYHNTSFREALKFNIDNLPFIDNVDDFEIISNLQFMAKNNCITLVNGTQGTFEASTPMAIMTLPLNLSISQRKILIEYIDKIDYFDGGLLYIEVVDRDGNVVYKCNTVDELYSECIGVGLPSKKKTNSFVKSYA